MGEIARLERLEALADRQLAVAERQRRLAGQRAGANKYRELKTAIKENLKNIRASLAAARTAAGVASAMEAAEEAAPAPATSSSYSSGSAMEEEEEAGSPPAPATASGLEEEEEEELPAPDDVPLAPTDLVPLPLSDGKYSAARANDAEVRPRVLQRVFAYFAQRLVGAPIQDVKRLALEREKHSRENANEVTYGNESGGVGPIMTACDKYLEQHPIAAVGRAIDFQARDIVRQGAYARHWRFAMQTPEMTKRINAIETLTRCEKNEAIVLFGMTHCVSTSAEDETVRIKDKVALYRILTEEIRPGRDASVRAPMLTMLTEYFRANDAALIEPSLYKLACDMNYDARYETLYEFRLNKFENRLKQTIVAVAACAALGIRPPPVGQAVAPALALAAAPVLPETAVTLAEIHAAIVSLAPYGAPLRLAGLQLAWEDAEVRVRGLARVLKEFDATLADVPPNERMVYALKAEFRWYLSKRENSRAAYVSGMTEQLFRYTMWYKNPSKKTDLDKALAKEIAEARAARSAVAVLPAAAAGAVDSPLPIPGLVRDWGDGGVRASVLEAFREEFGKRFSQYSPNIALEYAQKAEAVRYMRAHNLEEYIANVRDKGTLAEMAAAHKRAPTSIDRILAELLEHAKNPDPLFAARNTREPPGGILPTPIPMDLVVTPWESERPRLLWRLMKGFEITLPDVPPAERDAFVKQVEAHRYLKRRASGQDYKNLSLPPNFFKEYAQKYRKDKGWITRLLQIELDVFSTTASSSSSAPVSSSSSAAPAPTPVSFYASADLRKLSKYTIQVRETSASLIMTKMQSSLANAFVICDVLFVLAPSYAASEELVKTPEKIVRLLKDVSWREIAANRAPMLIMLRRAFGDAEARRIEAHLFMQVGSLAEYYAPFLFGAADEVFLLAERIEWARAAGAAPAAVAAVPPEAETPFIELIEGFPIETPTVRVSPEPALYWTRRPEFDEFVRDFVEQPTFKAALQKATQPTPVNAVVGLLVALAESQDDFKKNAAARYNLFAGRAIRFHAQRAWRDDPETQYHRTIREPVLAMIRRLGDAADAEKIETRMFGEARTLEEYLDYTTLMARIGV